MKSHYITITIFFQIFNYAANTNYNFAAKVVLITGSSDGIGAQTAIEFARAGANVVITGRNAEKVLKVAKQCREVANNSQNALEVVADIKNRSDSSRILKSTIDKWGKLDILVNCAGLFRFAPVDSEKFYETYLETLEVNLNAAVLLTHLAIPYLQSSKGNVVSISSVAGYKPEKTVLGYGIAKAGLIFMTKGMAAELGPKGVRVNCIMPGMIRSDLLKHAGLSQEQADAAIKNDEKLTPIGRGGAKEDVVNGVMFLASDKSSFITGHCIRIDGGRVFST